MTTLIQKNLQKILEYKQTQLERLECGRFEIEQQSDWLQNLMNTDNNSEYFNKSNMYAESSIIKKMENKLNEKIYVFTLTMYENKIISFKDERDYYVNHPLSDYYATSPVAERFNMSKEDFENSNKTEIENPDIADGISQLIELVKTSHNTTKYVVLHLHRIWKDDSGRISESGHANLLEINNHNVYLIEPNMRDVLSEKHCFFRTIFSDNYKPVRRECGYSGIHEMVLRGNKNRGLCLSCCFLMFEYLSYKNQPVRDIESEIRQLWSDLHSKTWENIKKYYTRNSE